MARRRKSLPKEPFHAKITDLTHEGRGVAHIDGKTVFVNQALPDEQVQFTYVKRHRQYDEGQLFQVEKASPHRIDAKCQHFAICGGCSLQHLEHEQQIQLKQKVLLDNLKRIGHVTPESVREPLLGPQWGYRRKARLGVRYVEKKQKVLIGFRERASRYLADLSQCEVLVPKVGHQLTKLSHLISQLSCYRAVPQIEVAVGDDVHGLVIRHMEPLTEQDQQLLIAFAQQEGFAIYLQPKGPDSITPLWPAEPRLTYGLSAHDIQFDFLPTDFVQVNDAINQSMIDKVITDLGCTKTHNILELFCGLGNFTLPIAKHVANVVAVEGEASLIERAKVNAQKNDIHNAHFYVANLMEPVDELPWWKQLNYDAVFLDPPRSGAEMVLEMIHKLDIKHIVYVSCNPATLARDAGKLVNEYGYRLCETGVMDMFPHTAHVESFAIFKK